MKIYSYDMFYRNGSEILGELGVDFEICNMAEPDRTTALNFLRSAMDDEPMNDYDIVWRLYELDAEPKYEDYDPNSLRDYAVSGKRLAYEFIIKATETNE